MQSDEDPKVSLRDKSLSLDKIDSEHLGMEITESWNNSTLSMQEYLDKREGWMSSWRDLNPQDTEGPYENSSNFHIPLTLINGKALHARLWQLFSEDFFGVAARQEAFESKVPKIKEFMRFILDNYANSQNGTRDVFDEWLWDNVFEGSGYLKLFWAKEVNEFLEVIPQLEAEKKIVFDSDNVTGRLEISTKITEKEEVKRVVLETPQMRRILIEDIRMPVGESDPQSAEWVAHKLYLNDAELKQRAQDGKFNMDVCEEIISQRQNDYGFGSQDTLIKQTRAEIDGNIKFPGDDQGKHVIIEWYGRAYIQKEVTQETEDDLSKMPQKVVVWVHYPSSKVLGWTYLYRISPSGTVPIFKSDFIKFPDRTNGVGVGEVLDSIQRATDAMYNLRIDNGELCSTPWGVYRSSSGLKPGNIMYQRGTLYPLDDVNDVKMMQFPYLSNFGMQEEDRLNSYSERVLAMGDIQMGRSPSKVGVFRTASGANVLESSANIQLEIHFDRIARALSKLLSCLFKLCRERIPEELYYRVTGENGEPIFGVVNRDDLRGDFDFVINVDVLGQSRIEQSQQATMMMQMLINPAFTQTGVITPTNLYELARNFLIKNKVKKVNSYVTPPQDYQGEIVTPQERIYRIVVNMFKDPPVEETVRMNEDHMKAMQTYEAFKQSNDFGLMTSPQQLQALNKVQERHMQYMQAIQAGSNPNMSGMQTPREGFGAQEALGPNGPTMDQGPLGAPPGEANGPVF